MITVSILINGQPVFTRSAHRRTERHRNEKGEDAYLLDTGEVIYHSREKGAIPLAVKLLRTIKEK